jgi:hypothetical protein
VFRLVLDEVVQHPLWRHVILFQMARATKLVQGHAAKGVEQELPDSIQSLQVSVEVFRYDRYQFSLSRPSENTRWSHKGRTTSQSSLSSSSVFKSAH